MWLSFLQGYSAVLVNNGTFRGEVLEAGIHEWQAGDNAWLLEKGGLKGTWENFSNRFSFWWLSQCINKKLLFIRMQPHWQVLSSSKQKCGQNTSANVTNIFSTSVSLWLV